MTKKEKRQLGRTPAPIGVFGGHRTGKRKRGNSLLKVAPKDTTRATIYDATDDHGNTVATFKTLTYKRKGAE
jgi:hypothetical protein